MTERKDIGARLENWARWATESNRDIEVSGTYLAGITAKQRKDGVIEASGSQERRHVDDEDALCIERAVRGLEEKHRLLLWWCYIRNAPPEVVCRKMSIPCRPSDLFKAAFYAAQQAIEYEINKKGRA